MRPGETLLKKVCRILKRLGVGATVVHAMDGDEPELTLRKSGIEWLGETHKGSLAMISGDSRAVLTICPPRASQSAC